MNRINHLDLGYVGLCADDVGAVLKSWHSLDILAEIFKLAQDYAGLILNIKKCFLVPVSAPLSIQVVSSLREYLHRYVPSWVSFNISSAAEYLGIWMGPKAGEKQWVQQIDKYLARVNAIAAAEASTLLSTKAYNIKALPVLSYPAQFLPPPPDLRKLEKYAFVKIFRVPYNAVSHDQQFSLSSLGIHTMKSFEVLFPAIKARFHHDHDCLIHALHRHLLSSIDDLPLVDACLASRSFWDSRPIVQNIINGT
eukprot:10796939-Karenia_brevis.AAC.1